MNCRHDVLKQLQIHYDADGYLYPLSNKAHQCIFPLLSSAPPPCFWLNVFVISGILPYLWLHALHWGVSEAPPIAFPGFHSPPGYRYSLRLALAHHHRASSPSPCPSPSPSPFLVQLQNPLCARKFSFASNRNTRECIQYRLQATRSAVPNLRTAIFVSSKQRCVNDHRFQLRRLADGSQESFPMFLCPQDFLPFRVGIVLAVRFVVCRTSEWPLFSPMLIRGRSPISTRFPLILFSHSSFMNLYVCLERFCWKVQFRASCRRPW